MGRHSAGDEEDGEAVIAPAPESRPTPRGRHARAEDDEPPAPAAPTKRSRIGKGNQSTAADLALLRERSDVRARVIAAVVAPFVLYTAVLFLIGAAHVYLIWVWIPLVTAGVAAGSILDAAHRKTAPREPDS